MKTISAAITGIVQSIEVVQGESISAGQVVINIESMKMIIPIVTEDAGIIDQINVAIGDFVNEGDTLVKVV